MNGSITRGACASVALAWLLGVSPGCRRSTPEEQLRRTLSAAETAAEEKDLRSLARLISTSYRDKDQNGRDAVLGLLRFQVLTHPTIQLLTRIRTITFPTPGRARVALLVGMASLPLASPTDLAGARADLYAFDLTFAEEARGDWRLVNAAWDRARVEDFF